MCFCSVIQCSEVFAVFLLLCVFAVCFIAVLCSAVRCIIKSFSPALPQLLSLDNLVSTVKSGGHNHCVGFPPGQRWSVWPGRRLATLASARSSQLNPGERKQHCLVRYGRMMAFLGERQKSGRGTRRRAGWEWLTLTD